MVECPPFLHDLDGSRDNVASLPAHQFNIENTCVDANIERLPSFRRMITYAIGKFPRHSPVCIDKIGAGPTVLGFLFGDVVLKLARPYPVYANECYVADPLQRLIVDAADSLLPLTPATSNAREALLTRAGEFIEIALNQPGRLPAIIANIDALTNLRLTERARAILLTGDDPGHSDLWALVDIFKAWSAGHE